MIQPPLSADQFEREAELVNRHRARELAKQFHAGAITISAGPMCSAFACLATAVRSYAAELDQ